VCFTYRELIAPCRVIFIDASVGDNSEISLTAEHIHEHESLHGQLPPGCAVLVYTGWSKRYVLGSESYMGVPQDCKDVAMLRFPGISPDAARLLVERRIAAVGLDTLSLDAGSTGYGEYFTLC
jgi:kynurenine formamidase